MSKTLTVAQPPRVVVDAALTPVGTQAATLAVNKDLASGGGTTAHEGTYTVVMQSIHSGGEPKLRMHSSDATPVLLVTNRSNGTPCE